MRKLLLLIAASLLGVGLYAQNAKIKLDAPTTRATCTNNSFKQFDASFSFNEVELTKVETKGGTFASVSIPGAFPTGEIGSPEVPAVRKLIAVPVGATPIVRVKNFTEQVYSLNQYGSEKLMPHQPSMSKSDDPEKVPFVYNAAAYARKGFVGQELTQVEVLGTMRGVRVAALTINPVQYDAAANQLKVRNNIEIEVSFQGADEVATQRLYDASYSPYFETAYKQLFNKDVYTDHPDLYKTPARMLVVAGAKFKEALKPWLTWKAQKGFYLDVHYTDEAEVGTTNASIKAFIHKKYNDGLAANAAPVFLALIGDTDVISGEKGKKTKEVTDLYYSAVDGDYFPEMYSFRMSASSGEELKNIIDKVLMYEKATMPDKSYLEKVLLIAGADYNWNPKVGQQTIKYGMQYYFNQEHGYTDVYSYLKAPYTGCYSHLNTGVSFVNYTAHGSETSWADPSLTTSQLKALTNKDKYFLAIGNCCITAQFDYPQPCFGEVITRVKEKGAYAYIGSSPSSYWGEDYYWSVGANAVFGVQPTYEGTTMGSYDATFLEDSYNTVNSIMWAGNLAATHAGNIGNITHIGAHYYWEAYHVLGDGSVMPYRAMPKTNTYTLPASLPQNQATYSIQASAGSYVAISKDGVLYGTGVANASGVATVNMTKLITENGNYDVVITRSNYLPVIKQVQAGEPSPYQPVSNLSATVEGQKVTLKWEAPAAGNRAEVVNEGFESGIPSAWKTIDADGDGNNWTTTPPPGGSSFTGHNGGSCVSSASYINYQGAQTPDNYLITPELSLANGGTLTFWVCAQDANYASEHYAVYASSTGNDAANFTNALLEETLTAKSVVTSPEAIRGTRAQGTWYQKTVQLPAGTKYVAFRHFNCTDFFWINLDDVVITGDGGSSADYTYTVYRDGTKIKEGLTATTFEEEGVAPGNHEYCVEVKYQAGVSPKVCKGVTINGGNEFAPVQNLTGSADGQKVTLKWDAPNGTNPNPDPNPDPNPNPNPSLSESFENGIPSSWKTIDADGDGNNWTTTPPPGGSSFTGHNGGSCVSSASYINYQGAQTPDNYLVTPELSLANGGTLTFWVCAQDANYASEHYAVYASSTGNDAANFTNALLEETLTAKSVVTSPEAIRGTRAQGTWYQKTVQLPAGTKYVAFRHFNCTDFFWINLDDIEIKANAKRAELLNEDFEEGSIPAGWTVLDADSDGNNWDVELNQFTGRDREALAPLRASNVAISYSSLPQPGGGYVALTPDNYLITPKVEGAQKISYKVGSKGNQSWSHDHYALCISKTGTAASDFEIIFEETMVYSQGGANFTREKDLPDGTKYVAFRHYNCTDVLAIVIDDVVITGDGGSSADYTYTVYRDGTKIKEGLTATTFEEEGVAAGNHEYCVEVKYQAGVSPKKCVNVTVDPQQFNPVQNLTAEQAPNSMDAILKWNAPASKRAEVVNEGFESGIPSAWKTIDADGDGNNWTTTPPPGGSSFTGHNGGSCVSSASYINYQGAQTPDNYLITPELSLPSGGTLTFWVCAQDANYASEHYAVYASSTGNDAANFTNALLEETLTAKSVVTSPEAIRGTRAQGTWYQKTVQLPAGTKYVAFRHFNCTDFFWLNLDDVVITSGNAPLYTYTIYRNNTQIASGVTETTYRDPDLAAGSYTYGVKVVYPNGESAMETTTLNITSLADVTVQKPYTLTVVGKTITVSCQGEAMIYDMNGRRLAAGRNTVVYTAQGGSYAVMVVVDGKSYVEKLAVK